MKLYPKGTRQLKSIDRADKRVFITKPKHDRVEEMRRETIASFKCEATVRQ